MPKLIAIIGALGGALGAALLGSGCGAPCPAGGATGNVSATSADPGDVDFAASVEKLADETCACPDTACAESVSVELTALLRGRETAVTGDPATRVVTAMSRALGCRDRLAYPSDPADMDGATPPNAAN